MNFNKKKNYANNTFRSLDEVRDRVEEIEKKLPSNNYKMTLQEAYALIESKLSKAYPGVKPPSPEFFAALFVEHCLILPDRTSSSSSSTNIVLRIIRKRMSTRYHHPEKYKTRKLASGQKYLYDECEEYKEEILNSYELELLKMERERRKVIGEPREISFPSKKKNNNNNFLFYLKWSFPSEYRASHSSPPEDGEALIKELRRLLSQFEWHRFDFY